MGMCMMAVGTYVAETDEEGGIVWVWVGRTAGRGARPFNPDRDSFDPGLLVEYTGAPETAMKSWLAAAVAFKDDQPCRL